MAALLVLVASLHLGTFVITSLFGYFALRLFCFRGRKILAVVIYIIAIAAIGLGLGYFSRQASVALPRIADTTIPAVVEFAEKKGVELPFTDFESLRIVALSDAREGIAAISRYLKEAGFQVVLLLAGLVVAASLFLNPSWDTEKNQAAGASSYASVIAQISEQFTTLFRSFRTVMGAQLIISAINTLLTAIFLACNGYPYAVVLIAVTFFCGLLPIVGNLISNTLIVAVGFTVSPRTALFGFIFLVVIHKLEYFLDIKIIGTRIKNPVWLMLIAMILGEKLMGISGMILAPVILHYVKVEASQNAGSATSQETEDMEAEI
jgi:predicted PurR-regulated permease PerM